MTTLNNNRDALMGLIETSGNGPESTALVIHRVAGQPCAVMCAMFINVVVVCVCVCPYVLIMNCGHE